MSNLGISRRIYAVWFSAVLVFGWAAMKLTYVFMHELSSAEFFTARVAADAISHIALFWIVRKRLIRLQAPLAIAYLCLIAFFFTPIFLLFLKLWFVIPLGIEKMHFWIGIPVVASATLIIVGLLLKRSDIVLEDVVQDSQ